MTRDEHIAWCKKRALEYLPGNPEEAFASLSSDLTKHEETRTRIGMQLGMGLLMGGHLKTAEQMRKFIEGFN